MGTAKAKVAWDELTYSKKGGVGLFRIRITVWNEAAVLRFVWNLFGAQLTSLKGDILGRCPYQLLVNGIGEEYYS